MYIYVCVPIYVYIYIYGSGQPNLFYITGLACRKNKPGP